MSEAFSEKELQIIHEYVNNGKSIRELSILYEGFGRTRISNIIDRYANSGEEKAIEVALRKASLKTHRQIDSLEEIKDEELTEEQIQLAYREIIEGKKTLTKVASELGKNRETIKSGIIDYLGDDKIAIKEFKKTLKDNQTIGKERSFFEELTEDEKKIYIFERLNNRRMLSGRSTYPYEMLDRKYNRLISYFEKRNGRVEDAGAKITKDEILRMMFDFPTMLAMSLSDKIKPVVNALDHKYLGFSDSSRVLKHNPAILGDSLKRTALQIKLLQDTDTLKFALQKPRTFRTSPEFMYALIKVWENHYKPGNPFITTKKMYLQYGLRPDKACQLHDIKTEYGDDEYFDGR